MTYSAQVGGRGGNTDIEFVALCEGCWIEGDEPFLNGTMPTQLPCSRCGKRDCDYIADPKCNAPRPARGGWAMEFTTSTAMVPWPMYVWDTNAYYSDLGISPKATKLEIRQAYEALDGQSSPRLTYVVKQLLNDETRRRYDAVELGAVFFDWYVYQSVMNEMIAAINRDLADADADADADFEDFNFRDDLRHLMDQPFDPVDPKKRGGQDGRAPNPSGRALNRPRSSQWGFYRWQSNCNDIDRLAEWRGLLSQAMNEKGEIAKIAVGFMGRMAQPIEVRTVGYRIVVFLSDDEWPNEALAEVAASRVQSITEFQRQEGHHP